VWLGEGTSPFGPAITAGPKLPQEPGGSYAAVSVARPSLTPDYHLLSCRLTTILNRDSMDGAG